MIQAKRDSKTNFIIEYFLMEARIHMAGLDNNKVKLDAKESFNRAKALGYAAKLLGATEEELKGIPRFY